MWPEDLFLIFFGAINLLLLTSYYILKVNSADFALVHPKFHKYMLIMAFFAYICNIFHVVYISKVGSSDSYFQIASISYYILQLVFIPFMRTAKGNAVRVILGLACIPIGVLHMYSRSSIMYVSLFVFIHVFVNDFILFSFMHDASITV